MFILRLLYHYKKNNKKGIDLELTQRFTIYLSDEKGGLDNGHGTNSRPKFANNIDISGYKVVVWEIVK